MELYVGTKIIKAEPMSEIEFLNTVRNQPIEENREDRAGYLVEYPDGYKSWSPKETFENFYRNITHGELEIIESVAF